MGHSPVVEGRSFGIYSSDCLRPDSGLIPLDPDVIASGQPGIFHDPGFADEFQFFDHFPVKMHEPSLWMMKKMVWSACLRKAVSAASPDVHSELYSRYEADNQAVSCGLAV